MRLVIVEGKGQFWGEFGASRCNQWGLLHNCARATRSSQITLSTCFVNSNNVDGLEKMHDVCVCVVKVCMGHGDGAIARGVSLHGLRLHPAVRQRRNQTLRNRPPPSNDHHLQHQPSQVSSLCTT